MLGYVLGDPTRYHGHGAYLARFNTTSAEPPLEAAVVHFSSSPVTVNGHFCAVPFQFGNVLVSM
jgi:hypothetical protein